MTEGLTGTVLAALLNVVFRSTDYAGPTAIYAQLHTAAPGANGTTAVAANTQRQLVTFAAASNNTITTSANVLWQNVPASETYTHLSLWDASSNGTFIGSGALAAPQAVLIHDNFSVDAGTFSVSIAPMAA